MEMHDENLWCEQICNLTLCKDEYENIKMYGRVISPYQHMEEYDILEEYGNIR